MTESDVIDRSLPIEEWSDRTREDNERQVREAYEREDRKWLEQQALATPGEFLAAADAIGVQMPVASRAWLQGLTQSRDREQFGVARCMTPNCYGFTVTGVTGEVVGGPHWHVIVDGKDLGANPWPPPAPSPPVRPVERVGARPHRRCRDCGDLLDDWRVSDRCTRCLRVWNQGAAQRRAKRLEADRERALSEHAQEAAAQVELFWRCVTCGTRMNERRSACARCIDEDRFREQPADTPGMSRDMGDWPHVAFSTNRRGETVVNGHVLRHRRYGESSWDRFGDTPELDDA